MPPPLTYFHIKKKKKIYFFMKMKMGKCLNLALFQEYLKQAIGLIIGSPKKKKLLTDLKTSETLKKDSSYLPCYYQIIRF